MSAKEFVISRLRNIFNTVGTININYEYDEIGDTHLIEITPLSEFNDNSDYIELERELLYDFNSKYFPSTILFVSDESLNRVTNPEFSLKRGIRSSFPISLSSLKNMPQWESTTFEKIPASGENNYALAA